MSIPNRADGLDQRLGVTLDVVADDVHRMPVEQGGQRLPGGVEGERPGMRDAQRMAQPGGRGAQDVAGVVLGVGQQRLMRADDALGPSRRARGEHDVGGLAEDARATVSNASDCSAAAADISASSTINRGTASGARMSAIRSAGIAGSSGTITPPALSTPSIAIT